MTLQAEDDEPEIVTSTLSRVVTVEGWNFDVKIYRLETDEEWALEVVDEADTSNVWKNTFASDEEALTEALRALNKDGADSIFLAAEDRERLVDEHPELARQFEAAAIQMPVSEALGMMAAMVSAPTMSTTSNWLKAIIGDGSFATSSHAQSFVGHLMTAYNEIVARLQTGDGAAPPSRAPDLVQAWCRGYIEAAQQDPAWIEDEDALELLAPFGLLSGALDETPLGSAETAMAEKLKTELTPQLTELTVRIHDHWEAFRQEHAESIAAQPHEDGVYRREGPKVGRNQSCPCGSGKKYKRCCGAN